MAGSFRNVQGNMLPHLMPPRFHEQRLSIVSATIKSKLTVRLPMMVAGVVLFLCRFNSTQDCSHCSPLVTSLDLKLL